MQCKSMDAGSDSSDDNLALRGVKRYFIEDTGPVCFTCGISGHVSKECPDSLTLPCFLCGDLGHLRSACPQECCHNCGHPGHFMRECTEPRRRRPNANDLCHRCRLPGHIQKDCSLEWRRYRFTTSLDKRSFYDKVRKLNRICYSCAASGHFGDECPFRHTVGYTIFHSPIYEYLQKTSISTEHTHTQHESRKFYGSYAKKV